MKDTRALDRFEQLASILLDGARDAFRANKFSAEKAVAQLDDRQLRSRLSAETNSVAVIMAHVAGNLRSRWTDFLTTDGEKPWRHRDGEFADRHADRATLARDWEDGWRCLFDSLGQLTADDLLRTVSIRGEAHTVPLAIQRSLGHCGYHVGQILLQSRILVGEHWQTITIPRGESEQFNQAMWGNKTPGASKEFGAAPTLAAQASKRTLAGDRAIIYQLEPQLTANEFIDLLKRSTLAARRPVAEPGTVEGMLRNADVIVTAREASLTSKAGPGRLQGVARAITDFAYCTYLSDLAVDQACQRQGIGRKLIEHTHSVAGRGTTLILLAAPAARDYYPHIGMQAHDSCWVTARQPRS